MHLCVHYVQDMMFKTKEKRGFIQVFSSHAHYGILLHRPHNSHFFISKTKNTISFTIIKLQLRCPLGVTDVLKADLYVLIGTKTVLD